MLSSCLCGCYGWVNCPLQPLTWWLREEPSTPPNRKVSRRIIDELDRNDARVELWWLSIILHLFYLQCRTLLYCTLSLNQSVKMIRLWWSIQVAMKILASNFWFDNHQMFNKKDHFHDSHMWSVILSWFNRQAVRIDSMLHEDAAGCTVYIPFLFSHTPDRTFLCSSGARHLEVTRLFPYLSLNWLAVFQLRLCDQNESLLQTEPR